MGRYRRVRNLIERRRLDRELERELSFHIAERMDDLIAGGMSPDDARRSAMRQFGNFGLQKERTLDMDISRWLESVAQDIRYALRMIGKNRVFSLIVVLSLGVGIAANSTLYSFVDAALLRPMPLENADRLVYFQWAAVSNWLVTSTSGTTNYDEATRVMTSTSLSFDMFKRFKQQSTTLSDVFAFVPLYQVTVSSEGQPDLISGQLVSGNYFSGLRAKTILGRAITDEDDRLASPVAVISYRFWERRFKRSPDVLGKAIVMNAVPLTIVGVTSEEFQGTQGFGSNVDISAPITIDSQIATFRRGRGLTDGSMWWVRIMARMKPATTAAQVEAELEPVFLASALDGWNAATAERRGERPANPEMPKLQVLSGRRGLTDNFTDPELLILPLGAISGILLLIVCVNVANLLLARCAARRSELSVRLALGGSRLRLVRQLLTETVLLSLAAGAVGVLLAYWGKNLLTTWLPAGDGDFYDLRVDLPVLAFTAVAAVITGILMGIVPALRATGEQISPALKEGSRSLIGPRTRLSKALLVAQVTLSMVLLVAAGMFIQSIRNLRQVNVGFNTDNLLLFRANISILKYPETQIATFYEDVLRSTAGLPGVKASTLTEYPLVSNSANGDRLSVQGKEIPAKASGVQTLLVHANLFQTLGVPILAGRDFQASDRKNAPRVAIVNEALVHRVFGNENPIGRHVGFGGREHSGDLEIVGVARDISLRPARLPVNPAVFLPDTQTVPQMVTFAIRTAGNPEDLINPVREAVRKIDSNVPLYDIKTQNEQVESGFTIHRMFAGATSFFGAVALVLASIGLFGLMSYSVERRTNEIGVRMALGARRLDVLHLIMGQTMILVFSGIILGFAASFFAAKALVTLPFIFRVAPNDPAAVLIAIGTMLGVACVAAYLPARRASRVDPSIALRCE